MDVVVGRHRVVRAVICGTWYCVYEAVALLGLLGLWVIMLDKFQWEPVLNALLNRIPNVFIARGPCIGRRQSTPSGRWREGWVPTMPSCSSRRATTSLSAGA